MSTKNEKKPIQAEFNKASATPNSTPGQISDNTAGHDHDDMVHEREDEFTSDQIRTEDPDELVHRIDSFKNTGSPVDDPDDAIHRSNLHEDNDQEY